MMIWSEVLPPHGGYQKFRDTIQDNVLPVWMQEAGYHTKIIGKFVNGYNVNIVEEVPPGWDEWEVLMQPYIYDFLKPTFSENGERKEYMPEHQTDVIMRKSIESIEQLSKQDDPFFLLLTPTAPHDAVSFPGGWGPPIPCERHEKMFKNEKVPRTLDFNEQNVNDKPGWLRDLTSLSAERIEELDEHWRLRLRSLQGLDEMVEMVTTKMDELGLWENTYLMYTSDNGFHLGNHRLGEGKSTSYEVDIKVPFIVRGPGVPHGHSVDAVSLNVDIAPTLLAMANGEPLDFFDGQLMCIPGLDRYLSSSSAAAFLNEEKCKTTPLPLDSRGFATMKTNYQIGISNPTFEPMSRFSQSRLNAYRGITLNNDEIVSSAGAVGGFQGHQGFGGLFGKGIRQDNRSWNRRLQEQNMWDDFIKQREIFPVEMFGVKQPPLLGVFSTAVGLPLTYSSIRLVTKEYDVLYVVWCFGEFELYDMKRDPHQINNIAIKLEKNKDANTENFSAGSSKIISKEFIARLDALLDVLRTCRTSSCRNPYTQIHGPLSLVSSLSEALKPIYDELYLSRPRPVFSECLPYHDLNAMTLIPSGEGLGGGTNRQALTALLEALGNISSSTETLSDAPSRLLLRADQADKRGVEVDADGNVDHSAHFDIVRRLMNDGNTETQSRIADMDDYESLTFSSPSVGSILFSSYSNK
eukprot:GHVL01021808.1.p1 GENE.GHVL01021808.1~~GHVL01021808.1.p1  ORF type:complete len:691 (+),score=88.59 GHVL01021808.1:416-2488(+)